MSPQTHRSGPSREESLRPTRQGQGRGVKAGRAEKGPGGAGLRHRTGAALVQIPEGLGAHPLCLGFAPAPGKESRGHRWSRRHHVPALGVRAQEKGGGVTGGEPAAARPPG